MATVIRGSDNFDTAYAKSVAIIADVKASAGNAGTFTAGDWRTRDLNTEIDDPLNIVTIASNQFTLQAGTYLVEWSAPAYKVSRHSTRLQNLTDSTKEAEGTSEYVESSMNVVTRSTGSCIVAITSAKDFQIQHRSSVTRNSNGFGVNSAMSGQNSVYTLVKIHKIGA